MRSEPDETDVPGANLLSSSQDRARLLPTSSTTKSPLRKDQYMMSVAPAVVDSEIEPVSFFRPSPMSLIQLYIPTETAQAVVSELGDLGLVQFRDLNTNVNAFQKTFTGEIRRLDEMERKVRLLMEHAKKEDVQMRTWTGQSHTGSAVSLRPRSHQELDDLERQLTEYESRVLQLSANQEELERRYIELLEYQGVLQTVSRFLEQPEAISPAEAVPFEFGGDEASGLEASEEGRSPRETEASAAVGGAGVGFVAGAIPKKKMQAFERVLWRALRGNVYIRSADLSHETRNMTTVAVDAQLKEEGMKSAFIAFVHGRETLARVRKICVALGAVLYDVDPDRERRQQLLDELAVKLDDVHAVLFNTRQAKRAELAKTAEFLESWLLLIRRQKLVFAELNKFSADSDEASRKCFVAEGWCPSAALAQVERTLQLATQRSGGDVAPVLSVLDGAAKKMTPPTFFPTNKFTVAFQEMNDAYGIARYGEINPSLFMIISFPFLFAVMFGDVGHALLMALCAAWMVWKERTLAYARGSEIFRMIFGGRYIILLMGLFSIFAGFIYNDAFSKPMAIFSSAYTFGPDGYGVRASPTYVYPLGIDPAWHQAENALSFSNSYKMKQSILLGIVQMLFGLLLGAANQLHFGNTLDVFCQSIPQMLFMTCLFGYLCFLIVFKWVIGTDVSVLNLFISMVLRLGAVEGPVLFAGQRIVQTLLVSVAFVCVPWMLLAKPLYLLLEQHRIRALGYNPAERRSSNSESVSSTAQKAAASADPDGKDHDGIGDVMVHQVIHTIEFTLSSVSNTASYLRLWALSLAHAQLSDVLWKMVLDNTVTRPYLLVPSFVLWFGATVFIMVMMEGMSAFLHTLRLHWVEFNGKFYQGNGIRFEPFTLRDDLLLQDLGDKD